MERILVTGSSGMIGSQLKKIIKESGNEYCFLSSSSGDLKDRKVIDYWIETAKPTLVFHLAAKAGGIQYNKANPYDLMTENLIMNTNVIESCLNSHKKGNPIKLLTVGSVCSYPLIPSTFPFEEKSLFGEGEPEPTNLPYGKAKILMAIQLKAAREQYGFNGIHVVLVNSYGPNDYFFNLDKGHVIPNLIRKFDEAKRNKEKTVTLFGDGTPTREFIYSGEAARGLYLAMNGYADSIPVNLGSGQEISIKDLAELIQKKIGYTGKIFWDKSRPNGQPKRCLNVEKAKAFGFVNQVTLDEGLDLTLEDYWKSVK